MSAPWTAAQKDGLLLDGNVPASGPRQSASAPPLALLVVRLVPRRSVGGAVPHWEQVVVAGNVAVPRQVVRVLRVDGNVAAGVV